MFPPSELRWISKPVWPVPVSVQFNLMLLGELTVAVRLDGAVKPGKIAAVSEKAGDAAALHSADAIGVVWPAVMVACRRSRRRKG